MAERRMIAKTIATSDAFLDMPATARCLYFTFLVLADDDGFVNNPKSIMRQVGASADDGNILAAKKFIIPFESGVIVIKHWRIHNYLRNDRYTPTKYQEEYNQLTLDENKAYKKSDSSQLITTPSQPDTNGIPVVYQMDTQVSIGKDSIGKNKDNILALADEKMTFGEFKNVTLSISEHGKLIATLGDKETDKMISRLSTYKASKGVKYKSDYATILNWKRKDEENKPVVGTPKEMEPAEADIKEIQKGLFGNEK